MSGNIALEESDDLQKSPDVNTMKNNRIPSSGSFHASYSGTAITAVITTRNKSYPFAELSTITYSIHREKSLVRPLGHTSPKGYTYGPRTVAGSLVFIQFDEDMIYRAMSELEDSPRILPDALPPFHITVYFNDEFGKQSYLTIHNITIVDNGQVMSIEDLVVENTMSYYASDLTLMRNKNTVVQSKSRDKTPNLIFDEEPIIDNTNDIADTPGSIRIAGTILESGSPATNTRIFVDKVDVGVLDSTGYLGYSVPVTEDDIENEKRIGIECLQDNQFIDLTSFIATSDLVDNGYTFNYIQIPSSLYLGEEDTIQIWGNEYISIIDDTDTWLPHDVNNISIIINLYQSFRNAVSSFTRGYSDRIEYSMEDLDSIRIESGNYIKAIGEWSKGNKERREIIQPLLLALHQIIDQAKHFRHHPNLGGVQ